MSEQTPVRTLRSSDSNVFDASDAFDGLSLSSNVHSVPKMCDNKEFGLKWIIISNSGEQFQQFSSLFSLFIALVIRVVDIWVEKYLIFAQKMSKNKLNNERLEIMGTKL